MKSNLTQSFIAPAWRARGLWAILLAIQLLGAAMNARALSVVELSFDALVQQAEVIVVATVTAKQGVMGADGYTIHTLVRLSDIDVIKGDVPAAEFDLRLPGGVVGNSAQVYHGVPRLEPGQRYVLFIHGQQHAFIPLAGAFQGAYRVLNDAEGEAHVVRVDHDHLANPVVRALTVSTTPTLESFITRIRERLSSPVSTTPP